MLNMTVNTGVTWALRNFVQLSVNNWTRCRLLSYDTEHTWVMTTWAVQVTAWSYKKHWTWRYSINPALPWLPQATSSWPPHMTTPTLRNGCPGSPPLVNEFEGLTVQMAVEFWLEEWLRKHCNSLKISWPIKQDAASTEWNVWLFPCLKWLISRQDSHNWHGDGQTLSKNTTGHLPCAE